MQRIIAVLLGVFLLAIAPEASALCDVSQARVIHVQSTPFNALAPAGMIYWVAAGGVTPTFYFVYTTSNQTYINLLNAALASGKQVRVTGAAAACPAVGTLRAAGSVVAVFMDEFN